MIAEIMLLAVLAQAGREPPRFATQVEAVYVDAFVTDHGRPVTGLVAADFDLRDNGVRQDIELATLEAFPLSAFLVFDASESVAGHTLEQLRAAGRAFLAGLGPGDQCGLLTFNHELDIRLSSSEDHAAALRAVDGFLPGGSTALLDGIYAGLTLAAGPGRQLIVVFTDGRDNMSWLGAKDVLGVAEESNVMIQIVGMTPSEADDISTLSRIAEATGGRLWTAASPDELEAAFLSILEAMKTRYVLRYEPRGVDRTGFHRLEVRLRHRKGDLHARRGYLVPRDAP